MPTITVYQYKEALGMHQMLNSLVSARIEGGWLKAMPSKFNKNEVYMQYCFWEDVEEDIKRMFGEEDNIISILKENGKTKALRRIYCFINVISRTLEIYRWHDAKTDEMVTQFESLLGIKLTQVAITSESLQKIYTNHSTELKQAMFKNVEGLMYETLRGNQLEANGKFQEYLQKFPTCLRVVSFRPKIRFMNGDSRYQVTINGDKGTIRISENGDYKWRPRTEIRQIVFMLAAALGLFAN
ncbi:hypothetical protein EPN87_03510 [archaeon]|nr:MAG: hypothetical protein EPN87_03510 [archaeon]